MLKKNILKIAYFTIPLFKNNGISSFESKVASSEKDKTIQKIGEAFFGYSYHLLEAEYFLIQPHDRLVFFFAKFLYFLQKEERKIFY